MAGNPVTYAEEELHVHELWLTYDAVLKEYEETSGWLLAEHRNLREYREVLADREFELANAIKAAHPKQSQASFDRMLKDTVYGDDVAKTCRLDVRNATNVVDEAEAQIKFLEHRLRGLIARMNEVGALLNFYAVRAPLPRGK